MALSTTIMQLQERDRARDVREAEFDRPRLVEIWRRDIGDVYTVIRGAMKPYVDDGSAVIEEDDVDLTEESLGTNTYRRLVIAIVGRRIVVGPVARFTVGSTGRIDMYRENRPTEDHRVLIVRGIVAPGNDPVRWLIEQKAESLSKAPGPFDGIARGSRRYRPLEPAAIESAVEFLLTLP